MGTTNHPLQADLADRMTCCFFITSVGVIVVVGRQTDAHERVDCVDAFFMRMT